MSSDDCDDRRRSGKGKAREEHIESTETTPLLASGSGSRDEFPPEIPIHHRPSLASRLLTIFLVTLSLCVLFFVLVAIIAYSYGSKASDITPDELIQRALVVRGPDRLDILNVTREGGIWLRVKGRIGVDAGEVIGVHDEPEDGPLRYLWKSLGRWGVSRLGHISVELSEVDVSSAKVSEHLAYVTIPPLDLRLNSNPPPDDSWLQGVDLPVYVRPSHNVSALIEFVRKSWREGVMRVEEDVKRVIVRGGRYDKGGWRSKLKVVRKNVYSKASIKIPSFPGLPPPGHNNPLPSPSRLVSLKSFRIESRDDTLTINASATAVNPLPPSVHYSAPPLPFIVSLPIPYTTVPAFVPVASVHTLPFNLTHPNVSLSITGGVLPLSQNASAPLSTLLANYVSLKDSEIAITSPLFPYVTVDAIFPALRPKPQILRDVTIKNMKILPTGHGSEMLASGTIFAKVVLPPGVHVGLNVTKVFPDVLVYDGEVPETPEDSEEDEDGGSKPPPAPPLPDPLPERAFAHIRPDDWLDATSWQVESGEGEGAAVEVSAKIVDVPLEVLPGRDREFRNFVGKVIFGTRGALAGVQGTAAVMVRIVGLPLGDDEDGHGEMELDGLPFQGAVRIGKKSTFLHETADIFRSKT